VRHLRPGIAATAVLAGNQATTAAAMILEVNHFQDAKAMNKKMTVVTKRLPMRQPSGGASVVVGDVNDVRMAKGCRMIRDWTTKVFLILEASK
jgi:hypothetical protein